MFQVRQLVDAGIDHYLNVLLERIRWLDVNHVSMWKPECATKENLQKMYLNPEFFGAFVEGQCVGGFILIDKDSCFWPNNMTDRAYYFHKLVVSPAYSGQGYSSKILEWIKQYGKQMKKDYIRLDYDKNRVYLRQMYLYHGFYDVDEIQSPDGKITVLAECKY